MPADSGLSASFAVRWLLDLLLLFAFLLHLLAVNVVVGGGVVATWAAWTGRRGGRGGSQQPPAPWQRTLSVEFGRLLPIAALVAVVLGIVPLLLLQRRYGPLLPTVLILLPTAWLTIVALAAAGYVGYGPRATTKVARAVRWGSVAVALATAWIATADIALISRPDLYAAVSRGDWSVHALMGSADVWPRFFHFLVGSLALAGMTVGLFGEIRSRSGDALGVAMREWGVRMFVGATVVQLAVGLWYLSSLPAQVTELLLDANAPDALLLAAGISFGIIAILAARRSLLLAGLALAVCLSDMVMVRQRVRTLALEPYVQNALPAGYQGAMLVALVVFALVVAGVLAWVVQVLGRRYGPASPGEGGLRRV
jgi:hypothetical protein